MSTAESEAAGLVRDAEREAELIRREAQAESVAREGGARRAVSRPSAHVSRTSAAHTPRQPAAPVRPVEPTPAPEPPRQEPATAARARRPEPVQTAPEPPRRVDDKTDARFDGARLVALQMAVAGSTREEVHSELQRAFRLADPSSILDDVFGGPRRSGVAS